MTVESASGLALEAREAAIQEVSRLLQHPEDLSRLPALRAEYRQKQAANKAQFTALVQSYVQATRSGIEVLDRSQGSVAKLKEQFEEIDHLCAECTSLIENHEKIQLLSITHLNITKILEEIDNIIDLPSNAEAAEDLLADDSMLIDAFKALTALEGTSRLVQEAMRSNHRKSDQIRDLQQYFDKVKDTTAKFESRLFNHFGKFLELSSENPGLLVACVRVMEMRELIDAELGECKGFKRRSLGCMEASIHSKFEAPLRRCKDIVVVCDEEAEEKKEQSEEKEEHGNPNGAIVEEVLGMAREIAADLPLIYDQVAPCFPVSHDIFKTLWSRYHVQFAMLVDTLGVAAEQLANQDILNVVEWVEEYLGTLRGLGLEEAELQMPNGPVLDALAQSPDASPGLLVLIKKYVARAKDSTTTWYLNILEADISSEPKVAEDGTLWSPGVVDFFSILNDKVATVEEVTKGEMLFRSAEAALQLMGDFIQSQIAILQRDMSFELLCVFANNNVRCYDLSVELVEHVDDVLVEQYKERLEVEDVCRGFLDVAKTAMQKLVDSIFADPGMADLLKQLYQGPEWRDGTVTATFVETMKDYFGDMKHCLEGSIFKRVAESSLKSTVYSYTSALLSKVPQITEEVVERMKADEEEIVDFFSVHLKDDKVEGALSSLANLRQLACSNSVEAFILSYTSLLDANGATQPQVVERICAARKDMTREDVAEVAEQCKEIYLQRQKAMVAEHHAHSVAPTTEAPTLWQRVKGLWGEAG
eukprot:evm.model.scf_1694.2 EVM.evm.TU.scf_1694.2   scf_1694:3751-7084(+)